MRNIFWTEQSRSDLAAIHAFIAANPESYDGGRGAGENSDDEDRDEKQRPILFDVR